MYCDAKQWRDIRRRILDNGIPKKQVVRETGISRPTINKMLRHEHPPGYRPRSPRYPKLGRYVRTIDRLLHDAISFPSAVNLTIQDITEYLRVNDGFAGSYDSVRNYIRQVTRDNDRAWERAYDLIIRLPKPRALDFVRLLSRGNPAIFSSARIRSFVREATVSRLPPTRHDRERKRLVDIELMRRMLQPEMNDHTLRREFDDISDLPTLLQHLRFGRLTDRKRAMVALATHRKIPSNIICAFLGVGRAFVRKYRRIFEIRGADAIFAPRTKSNRKIDDSDLRKAVFSLLHEPPASHGITGHLGQCLCCLES